MANCFLGITPALPVCSMIVFKTENSTQLLITGFIQAGFFVVVVVVVLFCF